MLRRYAKCQAVVFRTYHLYLPPVDVLKVSKNDMSSRLDVPLVKIYIVVFLSYVIC